MSRGERQALHHSHPVNKTTAQQVSTGGVDLSAWIARPVGSHPLTVPSTGENGALPWWVASY